MAVLTVTNLARTGVNLTSGGIAAAVGGDSFLNSGQEFLWVSNGHSGAQSVTVAFQQTVDGVAPTNRAVSVPAGQEMVIGPFPMATFNDTNGRVVLTYSGVTLLKVMPLKWVSG